MKVVSLFSGIGGLDQGFINNGFDIIWANDFDKYAVETYKANYSNHIELGDINLIDFDDISFIAGIVSDINEMIKIYDISISTE